MRGEAIGIDARRVQWLTFGISGAAAGLSGGLYAFLKGSVFPDALSIPMSVDGLVMLLLGGVGAVAGPIVGAAAFIGLKVTLISETDYWRAILGAVIIGAVLWAPDGIIGRLRRWLS